MVNFIGRGLLVRFHIRLTCLLGIHCLTLLFIGQSINAQADDLFPVPNLILDVAWSPNGDVYAMIDNQGTLLIIDRTHDTAIFEFSGGTSILFYANLAWNSNGTMLAAGIGNQMYVWDSQTWELLSQYLAGSPDNPVYVEHFGNLSEEVTAISWSPDDRYVSSWSVGAIMTIWDHQTSMVVYQDLDELGHFQGRIWFDDNILSNGWSNLDPFDDKRMLPIIKSPVGGGYVTSIITNPKRSLLSKATVFGFVSIIDPYSFEPTQIIDVAGTVPNTNGNRQLIIDVSWNLTGDFIVSAIGGGEIRMVNLSTSEVETIATDLGRLYAIDWNLSSNEVIYSGVNEAGEVFVSIVDVTGFAGVPPIAVSEKD